MIAKDVHGHPLTGANPRSRRPTQQALRELRCFVGDPVASVDRALAHEPGLHRWRTCCAPTCTCSAPSRPASRSRAPRSRPPSALPANAREPGHREARARAGRRAAGTTPAARSRTWRSTHPRDLLALQVGHQIDFFTGRRRMLRDRIARALPALGRAHARLSTRCSACTHSGSRSAATTRNAEARGRRAVELEPRDGWAWHAVAHVLEMQDRRAEGIAWLRSDTRRLVARRASSACTTGGTWRSSTSTAATSRRRSRCSTGRSTARARRSILDLLDASSLLWRLHLLGVDVGARWQTRGRRMGAARRRRRTTRSTTCTR